MSNIIPYLTFDGNCREAMEFYRACLGGDLTLTPVAGSTMAAGMPEGTGDLILHGCLTLGGLTVMASDRLCQENPFLQGTSIALCISCDTHEQIDAWFIHLAEGGKITRPLEQAFWGDISGDLTDKFGVHWMLNLREENLRNLTDPLRVVAIAPAQL